MIRLQESCLSVWRPFALTCVFVLGLGSVIASGGGEGEGLGLSIAAAAAALLGHPIVAETAPGAGTMFAVSLPVAEAPGSNSKSH